MNTAANEVPVARGDMITELLSLRQRCSELLGVSIESGVPAPDMRGKFNFVFADMRVGDSFMVPTDQQRQRALMSAKRMGHKATSLKVNGAGYRVWLIAKTADA